MVTSVLQDQQYIFECEYEYEWYIFGVRSLPVDEKM